LENARVLSRKKLKIFIKEQYLCKQSFNFNFDYIVKGKSMMLDLFIWVELNLEELVG
jgi:hypothetical protein